MRFKGLDLNLLVALDILLSEKNVSRAADRLCLSQSATSGALARLRDYFGDDLLTQVGRQMVLTPRASELSDKVRSTLMQIDRTILRSPDFTPRTAERRIRIIASDYATLTGLQRPLQEISRQAPLLQFEIQGPGADPQACLERGDVELMLMPEPCRAKGHPSVALFRDDYVVVAARGNSWLGEAISTEEFFAAEHVVARFPTFRPTFETWFVENHAESRRIACEAESFLAMPYLVAHTDRIALMHRRLAGTFASALDLRILPAPVAIPPLTEHLQWHVQSGSDDCLSWVRERIVAAHAPEACAA
ncbi:LysR family transcriptional regulator [Pseudooceanicola sp. CBS1P-1]|nr:MULTISPECIES: LysR family transcriptional regulator [Pseudooceanicola]MBT9386792.1 LysR family transcriptional regulator [Pseudooceanicola endophyticus]